MLYNLKHISLQCKASGDYETRSRTEDMIDHIEALALARSGRLQDARQMSAVPVEIAQRLGRRERAGLFEAGKAVWERFMEMRPQRLCSSIR